MKKKLLMLLAAVVALQVAAIVMVFFSLSRDYAVRKPLTLSLSPSDGARESLRGATVDS